MLHVNDRGSHDLLFPLTSFFWCLGVFVQFKIYLFALEGARKNEFLAQRNNAHRNSSPGTEKGVIRTFTSHDCLRGRKTKISDDKTINNNSNNNSCRNIRLIDVLYDRSNSTVTKFGHISQSNLEINAVSEYQSKKCHKFNKFCWNLCFNNGKFMFLRIISPQNPRKLVI